MRREAILAHHRASALAATRAAVQAPSRSATTLEPMPLSLIVAEAINSIMPMINHLAMKQDSEHQPQIKH
jgi:hypothetical protein